MLNSQADAESLIDPLDENRLGPLVAVYQTVWGQAAAYGETFNDDQIRAVVERLPDFWVASVEGRIAGFVGGTPLSEHHDEQLRSLIAGTSLRSEVNDIYWIETLGVAAEFQRKGWGGKLLDHIVDAVTRRGFRYALLQTTTHPLNQATKLFWERGFEPLLDDRGIPTARIVEQARTDGRPVADIRVQMVRMLQSGAGYPGGRVPDSDFAKAVRRGLLKDRMKSLPCKFIYDAYGSKIFEEVCEIEEYYPTKCELDIIRERSADIARLCGPRVAVVELGSGSSTKTRPILDALSASRRSLSYIPIDISAAALEQAANALRRDYPSLDVVPLRAEYEAGMRQVSSEGFDTVLALWLGTSIGNVEPHEAERTVRGIHDAFADKGVVILGIDLKKSRPRLEQAYNDAAGVTARFNLNLIARVNRELGGHFDLREFEHYAFYNDRAGRIEMHIRSRRAQTVAIDQLGVDVTFREGEMIHTENSYKFSVEEIARLAWRSGFRLEHHWRDQDGLFSINALRSGA
jgi:dimethylhistidine N-methyltransferase